MMKMRQGHLGSRLTETRVNEASWWGMFSSNSPGRRVSRDTDQQGTFLKEMRTAADF